MIGMLVGFSMMFAILFSQILNPMILSFLVVGMGLVVMTFLGVLLPMYWFGYIVLLTFLGGLLVVFVYVASLCPNEPIMGLGKVGWGLIVGVIIISWSWLSSNDMMYLGNTMDIIYLMSMYYFGSEWLISLLVVYLLLVLLVVVELSVVSEGTLKVKYGSFKNKGK